MKDYKKYIFDVDYTILIPDWSLEDDYFKEHILENEQEEFFKNKQSILNKYEQEFPRYNTKTLSDYFKSYGFTVSEDTINGWMIYNGETIKDEVVDGVVDLFKYLKENNKEIVILTSWFSGTQIPRLKRAGLFNYIDKIVAGEDAMKPGLESFELAIDGTNKKDCIMIGDSIRSDKVGADNALIDSYIVDKEHTMHDLGTDNGKIKDLIIERENKIYELSKKLNDTIIFVVADHGHLNEEDIFLKDYPDILKCLKRVPSIEPRATAFFIKDGKKEEFENLFNKYFSEYFNLYTKEEVIDSRLFGDGEENPKFRSELGDYLAISHTKKAFISDGDYPLYSQHAGYTDDEIYIPLIVIDTNEVNE